MSRKLSLQASAADISENPQIDVGELLLDNSPNAIFSFDSEGNCVFRNTTALSLLNLDHDNGANAISALPEIDLNRVRSCIKDGETFSIFIERAQRSYRVFIKGFPDAGLAGVYCSDITDLTRIEADMLRSQNILRKVLDTDPNMIFVKDKQGRFVLVNQAIAEVYGTSVDLLIGKKDSDFNPQNDEVDRFLNDDLEVIESRREKIILEEAVTDATGKTRFFSTVKRPLQLSQEEDAYVLGVSNDISEIKRLQEQLSQASKMEALGQLAGGIAHDFNNLLTAILGYADILKITHSDDENVVSPATMIQTAADRAKMLTEQLLGFARQGKKQSIPVNIHFLINDTLALLRRTIDPAIQIDTKLLAEQPFVNGDSIQLQQIIMNLALNARDAVLPAFRGDAPRISISSENVLDEEGSPKFLKVMFADNGCGMSTEVQAKIFNPFFTTKEVGKGTGLGLSTAYGIVRNHEGQISVKSEPGEGTGFEILLPSSPAVENHCQSLQAKFSPMPRCAGGTILLVDDHSEVLSVATKMLEMLGFEVKGFSSGEKALAEFANNRNLYSAAIIDLIMPGLSGIETIDGLKKIHPELPVLVVSGFAKLEIHERISAGGYTFLKKPFELQALSQSLSNILPRQPCSQKIFE